MTKNSIKLDHDPPAYQIEGQYNSAYIEDGADKDEKKLEAEIEIPDDASDVGVEGREVQWDSPLEFLLSCISMSVGLGNVWRFPFTAYENGGGAFLIPYLIVLLFIGKPIYYLEMVMGQFCSEGQVKVWRMAPIFKGVGLGAAVGTACIVSYYCSIMAITIYYFIASFAKTLPWAECNPDWKPDEVICNGTAVLASTNKSVSELYYGYVFPQYANVEDGLGAPEWKMTLCLAGAWLFVFFSLIKGVQSSGKVAYFTAIFPYIVLFILLIRGVTLEGAWDGIKEFLIPQWKEMLKPKVWYAAVGQCFFSLATGFGPIIMFASYNPFRHNVYKDAWIISLMDTFTSLLAGITVFAILGSLARRGGVEVKDVVKDGAGLAFISYPDAIAQFSFAPQLFAVLFFLMLFTLGVGSATSLTGGLITIVSDQWPYTKRWIVTSVVCTIGFLVGLLYVTPGGQFMLTLVDYFGANFVIYVMATLELIGVAWIYGLNSFCKDIEFMLEMKVGVYWKFCWGFFIPVGLTAILFYALITAEPLKHAGVEFPASAIASGWTLTAIAVGCIPGCAVHAIMSMEGNGFVEKFKASLKPSPKWGPKNAKVKAQWEAFKQKTA